MSIEAMVFALTLPFGGNEKVVMLGLANHAHADGTDAYPSIRRLASYLIGPQVLERYAEGSYTLVADELYATARRTVQRNLKKLEDQGWIVRDGHGPRGEKRWRIPMVPPCADCAHSLGVHSGPAGICTRCRCSGWSAGGSI